MGTGLICPLMTIVVCPLRSLFWMIKTIYFMGETLVFINLHCCGDLELYHALFYFYLQCRQTMLGTLLIWGFIIGA